MQLTSASISLAQMLALQARCINPVVLILLRLIFMMLGCLSVHFGVFIYKKLCFFEILFSGVDPFVQLIYFSAKLVCLQLSRPFLPFFSRVLNVPKVVVMFPKFYVVECSQSFRDFIFTYFLCLTDIFGVGVF